MSQAQEFLAVCTEVELLRSALAEVQAAVGSLRSI
jgi:hypothetical protein